MTPQTSGIGGLTSLLDTCKTPPVGVPAPFPNNAMNAVVVPSYFTVMILGQPWLTLGATWSVSVGDEAGTMGGVVSQVIVGPGRGIVGSTSHMVGGMPSFRTLDATLQNVANTSGTALIPSQTFVTVLR